MKRTTRGVARYEDVDQAYLEKRTLRRSAGWVLLWALGVGAVISGDYFGWNFGLAAGGFWGLAIATALMAVMYTCMVFSIAELSSALPHAGGFYSFVRSAMGPTWGYVCGVTDAIEYVITPAVIVLAIGGYLNALVVLVFPGAEPASWLSLLWWVLAYGIFVAVNVRGVELTLKVGLAVTVLAIAVLLLFYISAATSGALRWEALFNVAAEPGESPYWLPKGWGGVFAALPFAIWFYLAIEQLPLAAEEAEDAVRDMPRALILGIFTLLALSLLTLVFNSGVGGGAAAIGASDAPLADGFRAVFGDGVTAEVLTLVALTGLVASFHTIIYAYGRVLFALSRAGYFPRWMSLTSRWRTPHLALVVGAVCGLGCAVLIDWSERQSVEPVADTAVAMQGDAPAADDTPAASPPSTATVGAVLLNMAVFGAVISYFLVMCSYIVLRIKRPQLARPYQSPLGIPGAVVGAILAAVALVATFLDREVQPGVIGVALFLLVSISYYFAYSRHRLVAQAPEEEVALSSEAEEDPGRP